MSDDTAPHADTRLFHYTTLEGLAYILSSKSIRFSRLDKVNDVDEGASADYDEANTMVFVSCWTAFPSEMIELWSLYTALKGVRIGFPSSIFQTYEQACHSECKGNRQEILWSALTADQKQGLMLKRKRAASQVSSGEIKEITYASAELWGPEPVLYVDTSELQVCVFDKEKWRYDVGELGLRKSAVWSFEKEIRFRLIALWPETARLLDQVSICPPIINHTPHRNIDPPRDIFTARGFKDWPVTSEYLHVPLSENALRQLEITMAPNTEDAHRILVSALCHEWLGYVPHIHQSKIKLRKRH